MGATVHDFAARLEREQRERYARDYPNIPPPIVKVHVGRRWIRVDTGPECNMSGRYMVEASTGRIYGIKAYGVVNLRHYYGTLESVGLYDWSEYRAVPKARTGAA